MDVAFFVWTEAWMEDDVSSGGRRARMEVVGRRNTASETIARPPRGRSPWMTLRCVRGGCTCTTAASSTAPKGAADILGSEQKFQASYIDCILTISHYFQAPVKL